MQRLFARPLNIRLRIPGSKDILVRQAGVISDDLIKCHTIAEISFMSPEPGINVLFNLKQADDPQKFSALMNPIKIDPHGLKMMTMHFGVGVGPR